MSAPKITRQISKNIKKYRQEHGFTQAHLAELIEMEKVSISRIETGDYNVSLKSLEGFAEIFNISVLDLLRENSTEIHAQAEHISDILQELPVEEREAVIRIVKDIVLIRKNKD